MNKKTIIFISFFLSLIGLFGHNMAFAQETSETAPTTTEKLKERIEKIVEQRKDKVEKVLGEISTQKRGFVGQIMRVTETTLSLDVKGMTRIIAFNESVKLIKDGKEVKTENISVDDWATVMGIFENDSLTPKRIEFNEKSPLPDMPLVELGSLKTIKTREIEFQSRSGESLKTISINNQTKFQDFEGEDATKAQFAEEDQVLVVGYTDKDESYATTIRALAPFIKE